MYLRGRLERTVSSTKTKSSTLTGFLLFIQMFFSQKIGGDSLTVHYFLKPNFAAFGKWAEQLCQFITSNNIPAISLVKVAYME